MTRILPSRARPLARFARDASGGALIELALVLPLLLLLVFAIFDFGRIFWLDSAARKATELAVRIAAVRAPVCAGVPAIHAIAPGAGAPRYGTLCRAGGVCADPGTQSCTLAEARGAAAEATAAEIWATVSPLVPGIAGPENLRLSYRFDARLGFLGGPYSPVVSAELAGVGVALVSPLGKLAEAATAATPAAPGAPGIIAFPSMRATLPAEDLGHGMGSD